MKESSGFRHEEPPKEEPAKKSLLKKLTDHPLAKPLLIAGALHLPLHKDVGNAIERAAHATKEAFTDAWERENMVLDPQGAEQRTSVLKRTAERESRVDAGARHAYKVETEKKLEAGQGPSFKRMQFDLEKLNGVPAAEVASAEQKADALIEKYSQEVGDDLDEAEIKKISTELYGPDKAYDWGQASVTQYFNKGDRNCVAVSRVQGIVLEGIIAKLPADKRAHWRQTTQFVKQHEIAGLEHVGDDGKRDALYLLEGKLTRKWTGIEDEPGTATVPMEVIKKALVSSSPVEVKAAGKPDEVKKSADIVVVTDEPAKLNIKIEGKLKAAEFNVEEARREGLEPRKLTEAEIAAQEEQEKRLVGQVMEIQLLTEPGAEELSSRAMGTTPVERRDPWTGDVTRLVTLDATDLDSPDAKTVMTLGKELDQMAAGTTKQVWRVRYGTMEHWTPEAAHQAFANGTRSISVRSLEGGRLSPTFLREYASAAKDGHVAPTNIKVEYGGKDQKIEGGHIHPEDLRVLLSGGGRRIIDLSDIYLNDFEQIAEVIKDMPADKMVIMPKGMSYSFEGRDAYLLYSRTKGKVMMPAHSYGELIGKHPEMLDDRHFLFDTTAPTREIDALGKIIEGVSPGHKLLLSIEILKKTHQGMTAVGDEQGHPDPFDLLSVDGE